MFSVAGCAQRPPQDQATPTVAPAPPTFRPPDGKVMITIENEAIFHHDGLLVDNEIYGMFAALVSREQVFSAANMQTVRIDFPETLPEKVVMLDYYLSQPGSEIDERELIVSGNAAFYTIAAHSAQPDDPTDTLRGFQLRCEWEDSVTAYYFVVKITG